jgi:hypothetical protein
LGVTRRDFVRLAAATAAQGPLVIPLHRVTDKRAKCTPEQLRQFWWKIWPEAVREFQRAGIHFQVSDETGETKRSPGGRPVFAGLQRGVINLVITDNVPMDYGGVAGVTTLWEGYHLSVIALSNAHVNQVPYFSLNTCVHELLHLLLGDVYLNRPKWYQTGEREFRIDWYATRLWLGEADIREPAKRYLARLRA